MTLDELTRIALEKYYAEPYDAHDVLYREVHEDMKVAVLAVLEEVRKTVPEELSQYSDYADGWNCCRDEMLRRLDEMAK